jgi:hypothetical protein
MRFREGRRSASMARCHLLCVVFCVFGLLAACAGPREGLRVRDPRRVDVEGVVLLGEEIREFNNVPALPDDPAGPLDGVKVELSDSSGARRTTVTDTRGRFAFSGVDLPTDSSEAISASRPDLLGLAVKGYAGRWRAGRHRIVIKLLAAPPGWHCPQAGGAGS